MWSLSVAVIQGFATVATIITVIVIISFIKLLVYKKKLMSFLYTLSYML